MMQDTGQSRAVLVQATLGDGRSKVLEAALITEMDERYGSGGPGPVRQILRCLEGHAIAAGCSEMWLETGTQQPEAISLCVSFGYPAVALYGEFKDDPHSQCFMRSLKQ